MLGRKTLLVVLNNVLGAALGAATLAILTRLVAPAALGAVAFAGSLVAVAGFLTTLGLDAAHFKRVSEGQFLGDCVATYRRLRWGVGFLGALFLGLAAIAWDRRFGIPDATTLSILLVALAGLLAITVRAAANDTFVALTQTARAQAITFVENFTRQPAAIAAAVLAGAALAAPLRKLLPLVGRPDGSPLSPESAGLMLVLAYFMGSAVSAMFATALLRRASLPKGRYRPDLARSYLRFALPLFITAPVALLAQEMDTLMLGYFWSSNDVGYFYASRRVVSLLTIVPLGLGATFFPMVSELASRRDTEGVRILTRSTLRNLGLILLPLVMFVMVYAEAGLQVGLGSRYPEAANILRLMTLQTLVWAAWSVYSNLVLGIDRPWRLMAVGQVIVVLDFLLNLIFIPTSILGVPLLGLAGEGAALTTVVSYTVGLAVLAIAMPAVGRGVLARGSFAKQLAAATATGLVLWRFGDLLAAGPVDTLWELGFAGIVGTLLYLAMLAALREVGRRDWLMLVDLFSARRMAHYVNTELGEKQ